MTLVILMLAFKSLVIAAITLAILRVTRRRSAAERSTIAHLGLFALVALPLATLLLPALSVPLPSIPIPSPAPMVQPAEHLPPAAIDEAAAALPAQEPAAQLGQSPSLAERAAPLARYAYALPALALLLLTLVAMTRLVALRSRAQVVIDPHWLSALGRAQRRMGFKSGTALLTSDELRSPISWGLLRPTIVVNESALVASDQAEAIIAHELAHVIQLDWAKLMLARIATAVFWFNPLAWVLSREAHQLREEAADDAVLAANIAGTDYAQLLVGIARHENRGLLLGANGVAPSKNSLRRRVTRVLDMTPARGPSGRSWIAGFTAGMMVMAAPLAAVTFGPAVAKEAETSPLAAAAARPEAPVTSWSTRAGEGPNQLTTVEPHHFAANRHSALEAAVDGLHDDGPSAWPSPPSIAVPDKELTPDTPEFSAAWARFGEAIGNRIERAFTAPRTRPAQSTPQPNFNYNFDFDNKGAKYSDRELDAMAGIPEGYRNEIADAGFPNATRGELVQARSLGVTGDYVADMRKAGIEGSLASYARARGAGLSAAFIESLQDAGLSGSLADYMKARNMGVTGNYVRALRDAGLNGSIDDYAKARAFGISSGYVRAMAGVGVQASLQEYQQMLALGITSSYVAALHRNGTMITDPRRLIELKTKGWQQKDRNGDP